eukprot:Gb_02789 [translate_table: standard]
MSSLETFSLLKNFNEDILLEGRSRSSVLHFVMFNSKVKVEVGETRKGTWKGEDEGVLEGVIKYRWNALPVEQRDGIKNYISDLIVQLSSNEVSFRRERLYVNKLNVILVQVLKHEWPAKWPRFIPDLVSAAKSSETLCENCMAILKLLSEEVFDFSRGEMTQQKIKELKQSLNRNHGYLSLVNHYKSHAPTNLVLKKKLSHLSDKGSRGATQKLPMEATCKEDKLPGEFLDESLSSFPNSPST